MLVSSSFIHFRVQTHLDPLTHSSYFLCHCNDSLYSGTREKELYNPFNNGIMLNIHQLDQSKLHSFQNINNFSNKLFNKINHSLCAQFIYKIVEIMDEL